MKKLYSITFFVLILLVYAKSQTTGSFETSISFSGVNHTLSYYVPTNYDETLEYPLFIALHGCGGNSTSFRNDLIGFSSTIDAIILCPDFMQAQISGMNGQLIVDAINETIDMGYSIDTSSVYMTGFSCNGQETYKHGWNEIYPFAGIIPFNSWIPQVSNEYNFESSIPTCVCTGTEDSSYKNNISLYNNFINEGGTGMLNEMSGIGHIWIFSSRDDELLECFNWLESLETTTSTEDDILNNYNFQVFPNPVIEHSFTIKNEKNNHIKIQIYDISGKNIIHKSCNKSPIKIDLPPHLSGVFYMKILNKNDHQIVTKKIIVQK